MRILFLILFITLHSCAVSAQSTPESSQTPRVRTQNYLEFTSKTKRKKRALVKEGLIVTYQPKDSTEQVIGVLEEVKDSAIVVNKQEIKFSELDWIKTSGIKSKPAFRIIKLIPFLGIAGGFLGSMLLCGSLLLLLAIGGTGGGYFLLYSSIILALLGLVVLIIGLLGLLITALVKHKLHFGKDWKVRKLIRFRYRN